MTLLVYCENCNYEYIVIVYVQEKPINKGMLSRCPKCKKLNRIGTLLHKTLTLEDTEN